MSRGTVGAAVFGVYDRGDVAVHGYGQTRPGGSQEPDGDTLFEIGSITKVRSGPQDSDRVVRWDLR